MNVFGKIATVSILDSTSKQRQSAINKTLAAVCAVLVVSSCFFLYRSIYDKSKWEVDRETWRLDMEAYRRGEAITNQPEGGSNYWPFIIGGGLLLIVAFAANELTDRKIDASIERLKAEMERRDRRDPVLIAEDNDNDIELLRLKVLDDLGLTYDIAKDGEQAIGKISQRKYSAVLLDIGLPKVDGVAVFKHIQKVQPQVPIFITSGYPVDGSQIQDILSVGIAVVVPKPIKYDQLRTLLKYLCDAGKDI